MSEDTTWVLKCLRELGDITFTEPSSPDLYCPYVGKSIGEIGGCLKCKEDADDD